MNWQKKLTKFFSVIFLMMSIAACSGDYCVEADEFDSSFVRVEANPIDDGIFGSTYDHTTGGQTASWHETGLRANGEPFIIQISGEWIPWFGSSITSSIANSSSMLRCNFCAKKHNVTTENCICYSGQSPAPEASPAGPPLTNVDCTGADQDDPAKCTCTTRNGNATDDGVFHFPLNFYTKNHTERLPDDQDPACKYNAGLGLFLGLFGTSSNEMPIRAYHLFSETSVCPITRNSNGQCVDDAGADRTNYIFRSADNRIFIKDDSDGNNGVNPNRSNDTYHRPNEFVKLIIHDRYYSDNYGGYNVTFLQGVNIDGDTGLIEYLVRILEDVTLGEPDANLERHGGILRYMYQAIVQDSYFGATLQITLSLYIAFFGLATLLGLVEITKKELLSRLIKLSLVIFFTTPTSWYWYNKIIVSFFKDGMDSIVSMFSHFALAGLDVDNPILIAQSISTSPAGEASRFSYVDIVIKTLFSENVTKKIWGLFFESPFGFIYIAAIYALIGFFVYVMLLAAMVYMVTMLKLIFALVLGPIFIVFSLFGQTNTMFKNWLSFVGARSLEMVILFLILYTFVILIDHKFTNLLHFRVCIERFDLGLFSFGVLLSEPHRGIGSWVGLLLELAAYIFILQEISKKIPDLAGELITIGGVANNSADPNKEIGNNRSGFGLASGMLSAANSLAMGAAGSIASTTASLGFRGARNLSRASGFSGAIDKAFNKIPVRGIRTRLRDDIIDTAISKARDHCNKEGFIKGTAEYDRELRNYALNNSKYGVLPYKHQHKNKAALYDMSRENIDKRLEQKLVKEPLKNFLKEEAKRLKSLKADDILLGKDMEKELRDSAKKWAKTNLVGGEGAIGKHLKDMKNFIKDRGRLSDSEAAKKFAGNESMKDKFMQYKKERAEEKKGQKFTRAKRDLEELWGMDKGQTGKNFMRKVGYEEKRSHNLLDSMGLHTGKGFDPLKRIPWLDKIRNKSSLDEATRAAMEKAMGRYLKNGGYEDELSRLNKLYADKLKDDDVKNSLYGRQLEKKLEKDRMNLEAKREMFKKEMLDKIARERMGKSEEELKVMREKAAAELEEMRARHMAAASGPLSKSDIPGIRDGLTDFDGNSLLEAEARARSLGLYAANAPDSSGKSGDATNLIDSNSQKFSVDFGKDLQSAIGLQASNFGLEAADPFGLAQEQQGQRNEALINMRSQMKAAAEREAKMKSDEAKMKTYKSQQLQAKASGKEDAAEKKTLQEEADKCMAEAASLEREASDAARKADNFQKDIDVFSKS